MGKINILAIDGGGIRGMVAAQFLAELEKNIDKSIYDSFDIIAGTSTGAFIALNIAANKETGANSAKLYEHDTAIEIMDESFLDRIVPHAMLADPKYSNKGKRKVLTNAFADTRILDVEKKVLVTSYDIIQRGIVVFKSWGGTDSSDNPLLVDIADASSAAPTYFPTVKVESTPDKWLIDGGMAANNPAMCAFSAALNIGYKIDEINLVSVGTGIMTEIPDDIEEFGKKSQTWGGLGWMDNGLVDHLFEGNTTSTEYFCEQILADKYIRVNDKLTNASDEIDDVSRKNIARLKEFGTELYNKFGQETIALIS